MNCYRIFIGFLAASILTLSGCATHIMKGYIGLDIREVVVDKGAPNNVFDMGDGRRAFQWVETDSYTTPPTVTTTSYTQNIGSYSYTTSDSVVTPGQTSTWTCVYTMFAEWDEARKGWIVVDFKKPELMCG